METPAEVKELAANIRKCVRKARRLLELNERDSQLVDLVNHIDTLAQQIEE